MNSRRDGTEQIETLEREGKHSLEILSPRERLATYQTLAH